MEQVFFNFMAAVNICSDFGAQENKICHSFHILFDHFHLLFDQVWINISYSDEDDEGGDSDSLHFWFSLFYLVLLPN